LLGSNARHEGRAEYDRADPNREPSLHHDLLSGLNVEPSMAAAQQFAL
jgi:hypothetical protein